jgi:hypothetical protein
MRKTRAARCYSSARTVRWYDACSASVPWKPVDSSSPARHAADTCELPNWLVRFANRHFRGALRRPCLRTPRGSTSAGPLSMHSAPRRSRWRPPAPARKVKGPRMRRGQAPWNPGKITARRANQTPAERTPTKRTAPTMRRRPSMVDLPQTKRSSESPISLRVVYQGHGATLACARPGRGKAIACPPSTTAGNFSI